MDENERRTLTDADIDALTKAMRKAWINSFYQDLGKGLWALVWRVLLAALILVAAYGASKSLGNYHIERGP